MGALFWIIIILVMALLFYTKCILDPPHVRAAYAGKTKEQKEVIRYFLVDGCLRKKMSDAEYDAYVKGSFTNHKERGMEKIGIDEDQVKEIDPVHFEGYAFDKDAYAKKGADGVWRSSKYQWSWLFFSDNQVYLYQRTKSFDEKKDRESTEEYFYKDITNFSTVSESRESKVEGKNGTFSLMPVDTTQFKLVVPGDSFFCSMDQSNFEDTIQGMKAKLREKKQQ